LSTIVSEFIDEFIGRLKRNAAAEFDEDTMEAIRLDLHAALDGIVEKKDEK
jgi:hypothetical protein